MLADYFVASLLTKPKACGSFEFYAHDNLVLANNCFYWGSHRIDGNKNNEYGDGLLYTREMLESFIYILIMKDVDTTFLERMIIDV